MARTLFFRMGLRKFSEITNNKPVFTQYNIFYNYEYFFFQSAFWSLLIITKEVNQIRKNVVVLWFTYCFHVSLCTHFGPLQCFSTYFRKLKEIGVLRLIFPDYYFMWLCLNLIRTYEHMPVYLASVLLYSYEQLLNFYWISFEKQSH